MARPRHKPHAKDPAALKALCDLLVGGMTMKKACRRPECPSAHDVYVTMAMDEEFRTVIMRAREAQQHAFAMQNIELADAATPENWQVMRLRIWARQWDAARMAPRVYGRDIGKEDPGASVSAAPNHVALIPPKAPDAETWTESLTSDQ